jgi:hypothetical protein
MATLPKEQNPHRLDGNSLQQHRLIVPSTHLAAVIDGTSTASVHRARTTFGWLFASGWPHERRVGNKNMWIHSQCSSDGKNRAHMRCRSIGFNASNGDPRHARLLSKAFLRPHLRNPLRPHRIANAGRHRFVRHEASNDTGSTQKRYDCRRCNPYSGVPATEGPLWPLAFLPRYQTSSPVASWRPLTGRPGKIVRINLPSNASPQ